MSDAHHGTIEEADEAGLSHQSKCSGGSEVTLALHLVPSTQLESGGGGWSELKGRVVVWVGAAVIETDEGGSRWKRMNVYIFLGGLVRTPSAHRAHMPYPRGEGSG